uniref:citramalyl-CoA lyase, mitochondrial-like n=1 Tax=Styela clava TaxID=7725 RepID=UPI00193A5AE2|nr:citramalyl-CoA lyase, mitochondrial-like [Styela clava]
MFVFRILGPNYLQFRRGLNTKLLQHVRPLSNSSPFYKGNATVRNCKAKISGKTPRRAVLYVPGNDERKIEKIATLKVDCVVLDCEDGVANNRKEDARNTIAKCIPNLLKTSKSEICARVNSVSSGLYQEDLETIFKNKFMPQAVMLPKVEKWQEIETFFDSINPILKPRQHSVVKLVIFIETALGLINLKEIIESTIANSCTTNLLFEGIVFGSDDFCASIGVERTKNSDELHYARQKIIANAKAYDLQAIDMVHIDYKDHEGLETQSIEGASMGFTGKQVIHPGQIEIVQKCFSPSVDRIKWAQELIQAFNEHQKLGQGAFTFHGRMIDMPLLRQAESVVDMSLKLENNN